MSSKCRELAIKVARPAETAGKNVYKLWHEYRVALDVANKRLGATSECVARLSAEYAQGLR